MKPSQSITRVRFLVETVRGGGGEEPLWIFSFFNFFAKMKLRRLFPIKRIFERRFLGGVRSLHHPKPGCWPCPRVRGSERVSQQYISQVLAPYISQGLAEELPQRVFLYPGAPTEQDLGPSSGGRQGWTKWWSQWLPITESFNFWRKVSLEFYAFLFTFWRKESICDRNKHIVTNTLRPI